MITAAVRHLPWREPLAVLARAADRPGTVLLDSAGPGDGTGRFCILVTDPFDTLEIRLGDPVTSPLDFLESALCNYGWRRVSLDREAVGLSTDACGFTGGAVGVLGYELGGSLERLPAPYARLQHWPDLLVGLYDGGLVFDLKERKLWVVASGLRMPHEETLNTLADLAAHAAAPPAPRVPALRWSHEMDQQDFEAQVARAVAYIHAGDIFQANITRGMVADAPPEATLLPWYAALRAQHAAPFSAFMNAGEGRYLLSLSPERFLAVDAAGRVETRPIKGTRPRHRDDPEADRAAAEALASSVKDRAENLMIVDLLRNDLSRVCALGSVDVPALFSPVTLPTVHHLISTVTGRLVPGRSVLDLLRAAFPGGSITGAPKIRAMEIIHELEPLARGPYCGSVVWLGWDGAMDSSILIRSLVVGGDMVRAQAGCGIVADSDPAAEYQESVIKMRGLIQTEDHR